MISILIADPDGAARRGLALLLKHRFGIEAVREAANMEALICALSEHPADVLLLNWRLNGVPALETCALLRRAYPDIKICLLSSDASDAEVATRARVAFVHKGAPPEELIAAVSGLLATFEGEDQ
jgi:DNA-binding NarL/FixJ family response regulator